MSVATDLDQAIIHLEEAVLLAPRSARFAVLLGQSYLLRGEPEAALTALESAWRLDPGEQALSLMGLSLLVLERFDDAAGCAKEDLDRGWGTLLMREVAGWSAVALGHWDAAAEAFWLLLHAHDHDRRSARGLATALVYKSLAGDSGLPLGRVPELLDLQEPHELQTLAFKARDDVTHKAALNAVWLDDQKSGFHGHLRLL